MRSQQIVRPEKDPYRNRKDAPEPIIQAFSPDHLMNEASFASQMVARWGLVAAMPDGEDSAGRQKLRALTAGELVKFSCETSKLLFEEFDKRGWIVKGMTYEEAEKYVAEKFPTKETE